MCEQVTCGTEDIQEETASIPVSVFLDGTNYMQTEQKSIRLAASFQPMSAETIFKTSNYISKSECKL